MRKTRAKIGLISPNYIMEDGFHKYAPEDVLIVSTQMYCPNATPEGLTVLVSQLEDAAQKLSHYPLDLVVFGCTSGSCFGGPDYDRQCIDRLEAHANCPGTTTSTEVLRALKQLGTKKLAVLTPYPERTNLAEEAFLTANGYEVATITGMDVTAFKDGYGTYECVDPSYIFDQAAALDLRGADTLFISCTALDTFSVIEPLEEAIGLPVVTSNQVSLWGALRRFGIRDDIPSLGELFRR